MKNYKRDADGQLLNGIIREYFKNGTVSSEGEYINGSKTGEWKYYLVNGGLKAIGNYVNDEMDGHWKWYRENGNLMQTGFV